MPYTFFHSPSHGWVKVPYLELDALNILGSISGSSYTDGEFLYLEEDGDLATFHEARQEAGKPVHREELDDEHVEEFPNSPGIIGYRAVSPAEDTFEDESDWTFIPLEAVDEDEDEWASTPRFSDVMYIIGPPGPADLKAQYETRAASVDRPMHDFYLDIVHDVLRKLATREAGRASVLDQIASDQAGEPVIILDPALTYYFTDGIRYPVLMLRADALYSPTGDPLDKDTKERFINSEMASALGYMLKAEWVKTLVTDAKEPVDLSWQMDVSFGDLVGRNWSDGAVTSFVSRVAPVTGLELKTGGIFEAKKHGIKMFLGRSTSRLYIEKLYIYLPLADKGSVYKGALPFYLCLDDTRQSVRRKLGTPIKSATPYMYTVPEGFNNPGITVYMDQSDEAWDDFIFVKPSPLDPEASFSYFLRVEYRVDYARREQTHDYKGDALLVFETGAIAAIKFLLQNDD